MGLISSDGKKRVTLTEMNMTPMIDCVFLLLLFFMVGMKFKELDRKLDMDLPKTGKPNPSDPNILNTELWVRIMVKRGTEANPQPQYYVDQKAMRDKEHLRATLRQHAAIPGARKDPVILDVSDNAHHGWLMIALDYLHEMKFQSINFRQ